MDTGALQFRRSSAAPPSDHIPLARRCAFDRTARSRVIPRRCSKGVRARRMVFLTHKDRLNADLRGFIPG